MNLFDILAENQIASWEKRKAEGKIRPSRKDNKERKVSSFESQMCVDIENIYVQMSQLDSSSEEWKNLEAKSNEFKTHLMIAMERQGLFILSKTISNKLSMSRQRILGDQLTY
ncbi:hypothetical protein MACH09_29280 [Vibrio sp. MACH09]|uniref:hypothetical protein n=1 Tax=Vibrio sp. MACH09 TaxID=3025122 RepID=UPI002790CA8A|nr:hypothetical protein [Vibrio sp. MACH09]GLO62420.1 hypothetical protein MACH09_29280 [Vibrio sp. MACH09]